MSDKKEKPVLEVGDIVKIYGDTETATNYWGTATLVSRYEHDASFGGLDILENWNVVFETALPNIGTSYGLGVGSSEIMLVSPEHIVAKGENEEEE